MNKNFTHITTFFYDKPPFQFKLNSLSQKNVLFLEDLITNSKESLAYLEAYNLGVETVYKNDLVYDKESVPFSLKKEIGNHILQASELSPEDFTKLQTSIDIYFDNTFKGKNWDCKVCQKKGLDKSRNCGFRNEKTKDKAFSLIVGDRVYSYCPIYDVDKEIISKAIECFNIYDKNLTPNSGGFYDQTKFFIIASSLVQEKLNKEREKEMKKLQQENASQQPPV